MTALYRCVNKFADVIHKILEYDRRILIKNGKIIFISEQFQAKYKNIINLLVKRPTIEKKIHRWHKIFEGFYKVEIGTIQLSERIKIEYVFAYWYPGHHPIFSVNGVTWTF